MAPLFRLRPAHLLVSALVSGCAKSEAPPAPDAGTRASASASLEAPSASSRAATEKDASANVADAAAPRPVVGGIVGTILDAASGQALSAAQLAVFDEVARALTSDRRELREAEEALRAEVLQAVKGGKGADAAQARFAVLEQGARARAEDEARALVRLHRALEPAQLGAVAAEARSKVTTRRENLKSLEGKPKTAASGDPRIVERAARLERELALDAPQKKSLAGLAASYVGIPSADAQYGQMLAVIAAWAGSDFDEKKALDATFAAKARPPVLVEDAKFYLDLSAALRPNQREKLAAIMQLGDRPILRAAPPPGGHDHAHEHGHP